MDGGDAEGAARKFVVKDARVVIRRSGTEPKVRVMAECENEEKLDELCSRIKIIWRKMNLAVVFGGKSSEHDVSVITGVMTVNAAAARHNVCLCT